MSQINVDTIKNKTGTGSPSFPNGVVVTGVTTSTSFAGALTGDVTGNVTGNTSGTAGGLTGTPNITVGNITAADITGVAATFTGAVAIGGTLIYEDVTNVDSVGVITARAGVDCDGNLTVGASGTITSNADFYLSSNALTVVGGATVVGEFKGATIPTIQVTQTTNNTDLQLRANSGGGLVRTATDNPLILGSNQADRIEIGSSGRIYFKSGPLVEKGNNVGSTLGAIQNDGHVNLLSGNVIKFTGNETDSTSTVNFRGNGSTTLASLVTTGDNVAVTIILSPNGTGLINAINIDGNAQTIEWAGGSAPSAGAGGVDIYTINLFRTGSGNTDWLVTISKTNYA